MPSYFDCARLWFSTARLNAYLKRAEFNVQFCIYQSI
jgi:hypothetical protein